MRLSVCDQDVSAKIFSAGWKKFEPGVKFRPKQSEKMSLYLNNCKPWIIKEYIRISTVKSTTVRVEFCLQKDVKVVKLLGKMWCHLQEGIYVYTTHDFNQHQWKKWTRIRKRDARFYSSLPCFIMQVGSYFSLSATPLLFPTYCFTIILSYYSVMRYALQNLPSAEWWLYT